MITNLTWTSSFKIAILITDAPSHGIDYNLGCGDDYKDEKLDARYDYEIEYFTLWNRNLQMDEINVYKN